MKRLNKAFFNSHSFIIFSSLMFTLVFCIQNTQSQPLPQRGPIPFNNYDLNSNGAISQEEFNSIRGLRMESREAQGFPILNMAAEPDFKQFDTDKNGLLNPDELTRGQQLQRQKRQGRRMGMRQGQFRGMKSGRNRPKFEDFDQNNNGLLTPDEFAFGMQQHMNNRLQGQRMGMRQDMTQNQARGRGRNMPSFTDFDIDNDGFISEQELIEARSMRISKRILQGYQMRNTANITVFEEIDKNSDGKISAEEFSEQQKQHQLERQK